MVLLQHLSGAIKAGDCIANGWNLVTQNLGIYLVTSLLAILIMVCVPCVNVLLVGPIMGGIYFMMLRSMRGEPVDFGMMFKGFEHFLPLMVVGFVVSIPDIGFQGVQFIVDINDLIRGGGFPTADPTFFQGDASVYRDLTQLWLLAGVAFAFGLFGFIWKILLFFAVPLAMEYKLGPLDAMKLSVSAAMSNLGGLILLTILEVIVAIIGVLALCIGIFLAIPVIWAANAFAYRQVFPHSGDISVGQTINSQFGAY
ncbi:MAG: hypothetical protein IPM50_08840 [Acidobacteriota bacterium]|nr:MAG: hypothetical protein IPM50_08840 [Acidobacteriota bacterium]